ncbi:Hypothetical Protein FCC1311_018882 [Hondaea fermentalgiana]|uniref:Uncharacterized protein n=1 Tax=Hondaea fermentalgiana TaxID=2315210 RepID=A0A2R5G5P3_9STRA|nr:Hypothetical Protein FCC1311_018882 [Hondaea fermentalgiana]|eukprot:GBG25669.1 Hypothetical Protein FCC1311_018882 [Hondaea fermentalgiana]
MSGKQNPSNGLRTDDDDEVQAMVDRVLMEIARVGIAAPVGTMFSGLGANVGTLADNKEELQEVLTPFFFGSGCQAFDMAVSAQGGLDVSRGAKLSTLGAGDMYANVVFEEDTASIGRSKRVRAHKLEGAFRFGDFVDIRSIETVARAVIRQIGLPQAPSITSETFAACLRQGLPAVHAMLSRILFMEESDVHVAYVPPSATVSEGSSRAIRLEFTGVLSIKKLKHVYYSLDNIVQHLNRLNLALLPAQAGSMSESEMEAYAAEAPAFVKVHLEHRSGNRCNISLVLCLLEGSNSLLFMDQVTLAPCKDASGKFRVVPFDMSQAQSFYLRLRIQARVAELGCATFNLPELVFKLANRVPAPGAIPEEIFELTLAYMSGHHRLASIALRPFINIDNFRAVLTQDLHIEIGWKPKAGEESSEALSKVPGDAENASEAQSSTTAVSGGEAEKNRIRLGTFDLNFRFKLVPPRSAVTHCLSFFIKTQIGRFDLLDFVRDLCTAIGADISALAQKLDATK